MSRTGSLSLNSLTEMQLALRKNDSFYIETWELLYYQPHMNGFQQMNGYLMQIQINTTYLTQIDS